MNEFFRGCFTVVILCLLVGSVQAQTVEMFESKDQGLIPGQLAVYLQDDVTPEQVKQHFSELDLEILKIDIKPVSFSLYNPGKTVMDQVKHHPSIGRYEVIKFKHDSSGLERLQLPDDMTEGQKEQARKEFLEREDQTIVMVGFTYEVTPHKAESILASIESIDDYDLRSSPRIVYIKVEKGTESKNVENIHSLSFVTDVVRVAKTVAAK